MYYRGHRDHYGRALIECVPADQTIGYPLPHRVRHSPTGFEWGYGGSGPADTARSILAEHLGFVPAPSVYQRFKFAVIALLPQDKWILAGSAIDAYLARLTFELGLRCLRCADYGVDGEDLCTCPAGTAILNLENEGTRP